MKIEVKAGVATQRNITPKSGRNAGQLMTMVEQEAWAFVTDRSGNPAPYPSRVVLTLENGQPPYPAGLYTIADQSFMVGDFSKLQIGRLALVPVAPAAPKAA